MKEQSLSCENKLELTHNLKNDLKADELDIVEITMEIEDKLELNIPDEEVEANFTDDDIPF